jgi:signal transduction histidine kinase
LPLETSCAIFAAIGSVRKTGDARFGNIHMTPAACSCALAAVVRAGLLLLAVATLNAHAAEPKRILMLHSYGRNTSPYDTVTSAFRSEMLHAWPGQAAFYDFALESGRPAVSDENVGAVEMLRTRFASMKLDLVVTVGPPASRFYGAHREELFPSVPLLMLGMDQRIAPLKYLKPGDSVVGARNSPALVLNNILALLPGTNTVAIVFGDSPAERFWVEEVRKEFAPFENRVKFLWFNRLTLPQIRERVATLRPGTVVLFGLYLADATGVPYDGQFAISEIHAASSVPIFGFNESEMGHGIIGGPLIPNVEPGVTGARAASRLLRGESGQGPSETFMGPATPQYDWRELRRWHIDESRLPADSVVLFRPPDLWEEHRSTVVVGILVVLLQAGLIMALLVQLGRRRRAEHESFALNWRLLTAHEDERRRLARELHDDITQRLARLAVDAARIESAGASPTDGASLSVHGELVRLSEDVHALSYRLHPSILDDLGLAEALKAECEQVTRHQPVRVEVEVNQVPEGLPHDVSLCLFRVAQEALRNVARHAKASVATVTLALKDGGLLLAVSDNGIGFDVEATRSHPSLGCASMGERVRLLGGRLGIRSQPGQGTTISAWVPLEVAA